MCKLINFAIAASLVAGATFTEAIRPASFFSPENSPANAITYCQRGVTRYRAGKLHESIIEFQKALALNPRFAEAHNDLGIVLETQGAVQKGIEQFEQALAAKPGYLGARYNLASALLRIGHSNEAARTARDGLAQDPAGLGDTRFWAAPRSSAAISAQLKVPC